MWKSRPELLLVTSMPEGLNIVLRWLTSGLCPCRGPTSSKPVNHETGDQQGQLDDLRSNRDFQKQH